MKRIKRVAAAMCAAVLAIAGLGLADWPMGRTAPLVAGAYTLGDLEYGYLATGTYQITGYSGTDAAVTVPPEIDGIPVTAIGRSAFYAAEITEIHLPDTITEIRSNAFYGCENLASLTLPKGLQKIDDSAFSDCVKLTKVAIPEGVTTLGDSAFSDCEDLAEISIPKSVVQFGAGVFSNTLWLVAQQAKTDLVVVNGVLIDGTKAEGEVALPDTIQSIAGEAFYYSAITQITVPQTVTAIGDSAFSRCDALTEITLPERITTLSDSVFSGCSALTAITLPKSITELGDFAFSNCTTLKEIVLPEGITEIGDRAFSGCEFLESVILPDSLTTMGNGVFDDCVSLKEITLPKNLTIIGDEYGGNGEDEFQNCDSLTAIHVAPDNPVFASEDGILYSKDKTELIRCPQGWAGECVIPEGVTTVYTNAFNRCNKLVQVTIPAGVVDLNDGSYYGAFYYCTSLQSIVVDEDNPNYQVVDGLLVNTALGRLVCYPYATITSTCVIPEGVTSLGPYLFADSAVLTRVELPDSLLSLGPYAFSNCVKLQDVVLPAGLESLSYNAFCGCSSLTQITIPADVTAIGSHTFENCNMLSSVTFSEGLEQIYDYAFFGCAALTEVTLPNTLVAIDDSAFYYCTGLQSIHLPGSLMKISAGAFYNCDQLVDCYYSGTEADWEKVVVEEISDEPLLDGVTFHYVSPEEQTAPSLNDVGAAPSWTSDLALPQQWDAEHIGQSLASSLPTVLAFRRLLWLLAAAP